MRVLRSIAVVALLAFPACRHAPPSLSPPGAVTWQVNEVVVALGIVQQSAIGLNAVQICDPLPCHPVLSDANTEIVIDAVGDGVSTLKRVPSGWRGTALGILDVIERRLDEAGVTKLQPYLIGARAAILSIKS